MFSLNSCLIRTDVTSIKILNNLIFVGSGAYLHIFDRITNRLIEKLEIFKGIKIHGIELSSENTFVLLHGRDILKLYDLEVSSVEKPTEFISAKIRVSCNRGSWIFSAKWLDSDTRIVTVNANNKVYLWDLDLNLLQEVACEERCLLYSAFLVNDTWKDLVILSGTIFKEILLWKPSVIIDNQMCPVRKRLHGHKGVIFSVCYNPHAHAICSTSDDRTAILWQVPCDDLNTAIELDSSIETKCTVSGHLSRVFRCKVLQEHFFTGGEDGIINMWNLNGSLLKRFETQQGSQIWSLDCDESNQLLFAGGADGSVTMFTYEMRMEEEILMVPDDAIPKKLVLLSSNNIITVTDKGVLYLYNIIAKEWLKVRDAGDLEKYALLEVSKCRKLISLSGFDGQVYIYKECGNNLELVCSNMMDIESRIFSFHWLSCYIFLVCQRGKLTLCEIEDRKIKQLHIFIFPIMKDCWTTTACLGPNSTVIAGDRKGHLHVFKIGQENSIQTIKRAHNHLGVTFLELAGSSLTSLGRDATIKVFFFNNENKFELVSSDKTPITWLASKIDNKVIAAFSGDDFVLWDFKSKRAIWQYKCGGGHRSFDFRKVCNLMCFTFIKNKSIHLLLGNWDAIFPKDIIPGFHIKEINALDIINLKHQIILISGGEDTNIKISSVEKDSSNSLRTISNFKSHLSSIRTVFVSKLDDNENKYLIFTGGGRAQIILWLLELERHNGKISEIVCSEQDMFHEELEKEETEMRIMDIHAIKMQESLKVFAACSDGNIKIFTIEHEENGNYKMKFQQKIFYKLRCILKVTAIQFEEMYILVTLSTDGMIVFWNTSNDIYEIIKSVHVHQSGINSYSSLFVKDLFYILTGGDDNSIVLTALRLKRIDRSIIIEHVSSWTDDGTHITQVSGVFICDKYFLTAGVDERLAVFQWEYRDKLQCNLLNIYRSTVTDVQGMHCFQENNCFNVFLHGRGLEYVKVQRDREIVER